MSLKENTPKDTNIKLMLLRRSGGTTERPTPLEECYTVVDITEPVLEKLDDFGNRSVLGVWFETPNAGQRWTPLFYQYQLLDKITYEVNRIFDASIVNEKQKQALKDLFYTRLREVFDSESRTLDLAVSIEQMKESRQ